MILPMTHFVPDEHLIQSSLAGDAAAFGQLYERYVERIHKYLYYRTFQREIAEDLTSQTFLQALERRSSFDLKKGTFSSWIYRIARNLLIDQVRATKPTVEFEPFSDLLRDRHDLVRSAEQKELLEQIQHALQSLTEEQREIILLRIWDERSYAEIAHILGKSEASCKMAVSRGLSAVRKMVPLATFLLLIHLIPSSYV